jgi:DNA repair ATPase RecN
LHLIIEIAITLKKLQDEFQAERHELNEVVQRSKQLLTEKIEEFKWQKNEYEKLLAENQQLSHYKRSILVIHFAHPFYETSLVFKWPFFAGTGLLNSKPLYY